MQRVSSEFILPVVAARQAPTRPRYYWLFALWMAIGTAVATIAGTVLGIFSALEVSVAADRWSQSVQTHGRLQLFGFIAPFVVALLMEFLPRLGGTAPIAARDRIAAPAFLAAGAILAAAGTLAKGAPPVVAVAGAALFAIGAVWTLAVTWRQRPSIALSVDPQPLFLRAATGWLCVAAVLSLWFTARAETGVTDLDGSRAKVEVFLRGFVMLAIIGVGLRVFVGHMGLRPLDRGQQRAVLAAMNVSIGAWLVGQGLGPLPAVDMLSRIGDFGYTFTLLVLTSWLGVMSRVREPGEKEVYEVLIPVAWAAAIIYAVTLGGLAVVGYDGLTLYQEGAIRHVFLLGFVVPLMIAVSHIVLARFGTGRLEWQPVLTASFVILVAAWPLRVVPAVLSDAPGDTAKFLLGIAGAMTIVSLGLAAGVFARTALVCHRSRL